MPLKTFHLNSRKGFETEGVFLDIRNRLIRLKGVVDTKSAPQKYTYVPEGIVEFPELAALGIVGLWTFDAVISSTSASVTFQGSTDGGSTWRGWDGVWSSDVWCSLSDFSQNLPTFPLDGTSRRFKVRAKLVRSPDGSTPSLSSPSLSYDLAPFDYAEDMLRTLKHFVEGIEVPLSFLKVLTASSNKVIIDTDFTVSSVTATYNLTADPLRQINLFQSFSGNEVTMTSIQTAGSQIEVRYKGKAPVFISANSDIEVTNLPTFVIVADRTDEERATRTAAQVIERRRSAYNARLFIHPPQKRTPIEVRCLHEFNKQAGNMASAVEHFLRDAVIPMEFSGEEMVAVDLTPLVNRDEVSEGLFQKAVGAEMVCADWSATLGTRVDAKLLRTIRLSAGGDTVERFQD